MSVNNDYSSLWNQNKLNLSNSLFGDSSNDLLSQWAMRHANSAAYKKLLQAQETGTVKQNQGYTDLLSDKFFNDNYDASTGKVTKPTYTPSTASDPTVDSDLTAGEIIDSMRRLALGAISNPNGLTDAHYSMFEQMRQAIASAFNSGKGTGTTEVTTEEAKPAVLTQSVEERLIIDQQVFTIAGPDGEKTFTLNPGDTLESAVAAINAASSETGVSAVLEEDENGYTITLTTKDEGKDAFIRVDQTVGDLFAYAGNSRSAQGADEVKSEAETVAKGEDSWAAVAAGVFSGALFSDQTFTITGAGGSKQFSFAAGTSAEDMVQAINDAGLGITAEVIRNSSGEAEGIGLLADKAGAGYSISITQDKGDLFAAAGKTIKVTGSSIDGSADGPAITSLSDLGRITLDGKTYSFADLGPGGSASLAKNPDAALAVLDQALRDLYSGRAEVKGFDPYAMYVPDVSGSWSDASTNTMEIGNFGSRAITDWIGKYVRAEP